MASDADEPRFGAEDVILVASKLTLDDATFVVGRIRGLDSEG